MILWFRDIFRERTFIGEFRVFIQMGFKIGIVFFIFRELLFFVRIFWTYFHFLFIFSGELGFNWPLNSQKVNIFRIPLLNTLLLLSSGVTLTIRHINKTINKRLITIKFLKITIILGVVFLFFQLWEYSCLDFLIRDSRYGSIFFIGTGFHGLHVFIGLLILVFYHQQIRKTTWKRSFFDLARWYWHFVDIVWIFLYCEFYWWSF